MDVDVGLVVEIASATVPDVIAGLVVLEASSSQSSPETLGGDTGEDAAAAATEADGVAV